MVKTKIGHLIKAIDERNKDGIITDFYGININKEFMPTVANIKNTNSNNYKIVRQNCFVFSGMQTGRDECIRISLYQEKEPILISPAYTAFKIDKTELVIAEYFFMYFLRKETDRYGWFLSDASIRSNLDWDIFCDIEIYLPSIEEQQKVVDVYNAMVNNHKSYEAGLEDLKFTCDAYIENLRREVPIKRIGKYIEQRNENNDGSVKLAQGISIEKAFIRPQRLGGNLIGLRIVRKGQFAYCDVMHNPDSKMPIALRKDKDCVVSATYKTFEIVKPKELLSEYLMMWFERPEFERYAAYNSFGSARPVFDFFEMQQVAIPIPKIEIQQSIVNIYNAYIKRKKINEKLKVQIKDICPILIRGSLK